MNDSTLIPGARFNTWLAQVAVPLREHAGRRREEVAVLADVGIDQVRRFERGDTNAPRQLERLIAAYAELADGEISTVDIYQRAVDLWREHGVEPILGASSAPHVAMPERPRFPSERADAERGSAGH